MKSILLFLLLMVVSVLTFADADGPDFLDVRNVEANDVLNMRERPDWRSTKLDEIPFNGVCLRHLQCIGGLTFQESSELSEQEKQVLRRERPRWCQIIYQKTVAWVSAKYVQESLSSCKAE